MKRFLLLSALLGASRGELPAQARITEVYTVDGAHSILDFTTRLLGFNRVRGAFTDWRADFVYDPNRPTAGYVAFTADANTIGTKVDERDRDLRKEPFFDVARFPTLSFEGRIVGASGSRFEVEGRLTIRDSSRTIRFPLELMAPEADDPFGNRRVVFSGRVVINRHDFGVTGPRFWQMAISDSVAIEMEMAGRIWTYTRLGLRPGHMSAIVAAADSGGFAAGLARFTRDLAAEPDTAKLPKPFETEITVGRMRQAGKVREALQVLELVGPIAEQRWSVASRSGYETRRGEMLLRLGRRDEARQHFDRAIAIDPNNTNARAWRAAAALSP